jgi:hypothetical protein
MVFSLAKWIMESLLVKILWSVQSTNQLFSVKQMAPCPSFAHHGVAKEGAMLLLFFNLRSNIDRHLDLLLSHRTFLDCV